MLSITAAYRVATLQNAVDQSATIRIQMWLNQCAHSLAAMISSRKPLVFLFGVSFLSIGCLQTTGPDGGLDQRDFTGDQRSSTGERFADYNIVTVLPRDAIPAIDNPKFVSAQEANEQYAEDELVLGVEFNGDARAYSIPMLSSNEIVNDTVGGVKIAVTW